eukprot:TRINITY_DN7069_c0_g1_i3.p1 TRINITY_DN7069_c0_g1~~TRINITY_DN7069_c0_g1_i3.p1  ORF type:complete len:418 (+),score=15.06 TRINITY_DN7069_c0_g1_i3:134-1255(+)
MTAVSTLDPKQGGRRFIRKHLLDMTPYQPILPFEVLSKKLGIEPKNIVKLDANENPYGPPPEVKQALMDMEFPHIYPDPMCTNLRQALANLHEFPEQQILVGCGADELIDLLMRCVLEPGDYIIDCPPTFTMYTFDAQVNAANVISIPRNDDFSLDMPGIKKAVTQFNPKMIFVTSPNNPDGSIIGDNELCQLLQLPLLVVLDEAYVEFADIGSKMAWINKFDNLVVLRTFSKSAGLAGLRVGYGFFPQSISEYLWRAKQPYNVSVASQTAAYVALQCKDYLESTKQKLLKERQRLFLMLQQFDFLQPYPSQSNFILCKVSGGYQAKQVKMDLEKYGVMVRHYDTQLLDGYIRISVGKPEHTDTLINALQAIR